LCTELDLPRRGTDIRDLSKIAVGYRATIDENEEFSHKYDWNGHLFCIRDDCTPIKACSVD